MSLSPHQFPLSLKLDHSATFGNFWSAANPLLVEQLVGLNGESGESWVFIAGPQGSGKTHLLQAVSAAAIQKQQHPVYLNMYELLQLQHSARTSLVAAELFEGLEHYDVVCIDDIQALRDHSQWQEALFYLLVKLKSRSTSRLVMSANNSVANLGLSLPDLVSRLASASAYRLPNYSDSDKTELLVFRAEQSGFSLPHEVAGFIVQRYSRKIVDLMTALEKMDGMALSQSRKLTIPFVKEILKI